MNALTSLYLFVMSYLRRDEGQDFIEYALIIVLIVIAAIVGMTAVGDGIAGIWDQIVGFLGG